MLSVGREAQHGIPYALLLGMWTDMDILESNFIAI